MVSSAGWTASATANAIEYRSRLDEYKETLTRLFPVLPKDSVDAWSISEADILALGLLLECYPQEVAVLDIGTFVGRIRVFLCEPSEGHQGSQRRPQPYGSRRDQRQVGDAGRADRLRTLETSRCWT